MEYRIMFDVVDNNYELIYEEVLKKELTDPTVGEIKSLCNNGRYLDINREIFFSKSFFKPPTNDEIVTTSDVIYKIVLN